MSANRRLLSPSSKDESTSVKSLDYDFVVILAVMVCALVCVLGLIAAARCSWIRRLVGEGTAVANKGLKKKVLKSLPMVTFGENAVLEGKISDCAICLADFVAGEEVRVLPQCGHGFHVVCIDTWLGSHSSCPSCRHILVVTQCRQCGQSTDADAANLQPAPRENFVNHYLP